MVRHFLSSGNEHSIHSPFVFKFLTEGIYQKRDVPVFEKIENIRRNLLKDNRELNVRDFGAGSRFDGIPQKRKVKEIANRFAKSPRYCRLLYRITNYLKPAVMIELGTSLGISAMYQSAGNPEGKLYTLEGCTETANIAENNFKNNGFANIQCITGDFEQTLPALISNIKLVDYVFIDGNHTYDATMNYFHLFKMHINNKSVLIFDDINWSEGMKIAWKEIKSDPSVTVTLDLFTMGIVFFDKGLSKEDFLIRYW